MGATCLGDDPLFFAIIDKADGKAAGVASYLRITPAAAIQSGACHFGEGPAKGARKSRIATVSSTMNAAEKAR